MSVLTEWMEKYRDKMLKMTQTTLRDGRERQFSICDDGGSFSTTRTCVGNKCYVRSRPCRGKLKGDFHTHPGAPPSPSDGDFLHAYHDNFREFCIGSGNASKMPPKVIIRDGKVVGKRHMIGWSRKGVPEVHCFRWVEKPLLTAWFEKNKLDPNPEVEGRWTIEKYTKSLEKISEAFYRDVWFGGGTGPSLIELVKKFEK